MVSLALVADIDPVIVKSVYGKETQFLPVFILAKMTTDTGKVPSGIAAAAPEFLLPAAQEPAQNWPMAAYGTESLTPKVQIDLS